jgi:preprotein translocase subunit SecD
MPVGKLLTIFVVFMISLYASAPSLKLAGIFSPFMAADTFNNYRADAIGLGLDLRGGMDLVYEVKTNDAEEIRTAVEIIRNRIDLYGVANANVQVQAGNQIRAQIPVTDEEQQRHIKEAIDLTDLLKLHAVVTESQSVMALAPTKDQIVLQQSLPKEKQGKESPSWFLLKKKPELTGDSLANAYIGFDSTNGSPTIQLTFNSKGTEEFREISKRMLGKRLAVVLGNKVYIAPTMQSEIPNGKARITGNFDIEEARRVTSIMKAGALPAELTKLAESTVGPTLGKESIHQGMSAAGAGFIVVLIYMVLYYKLAGVFAVVALLMNLLLLLAGLKFFDAALTLPGIAGVILTIGMAVDANVIIFERIREERNLGKSIRGSIAGGFDKALSAVLDSNLTTIITAVVLYLFGSGPVKGFAVTLILGIVSSLFTALFCVRTFLEATYFGKKTGTISI